MLNLSDNFGATDEAINELTDTLSSFVFSHPKLHTLIFNAKQTKGIGASMRNFVSKITDSTTLKVLDISGHNFGDKGAFGVSDFLRENEGLTSLNMDRNGVTSSGYLALVRTIPFNNTLCEFTHPTNDLKNVRYSLGLTLVL